MIGFATEMTLTRLYQGFKVGLVLVIAIVWAIAGYELERKFKSYQHDAEVRSVMKAQIFAEYSRSTVKRINEFLLDTRSLWTGNWNSFSIDCGWRSCMQLRITRKTCVDWMPGHMSIYF